MAKDRFIPNLFPNLEPSVAEKAELQALVTTFIDEHLPNYKKYTSSKTCKVDTNRWKLVKTQDVRLYSDRDTTNKRHSANKSENKASNLPVVLCEGSVPGKLEDVMFGIVSPTLELMRLKASYIDDNISSASLLSQVVKPTPEDPLQSLVIKWMQLDLPLSSTNLVKNRDFVYMEATGLLQTRDRERVGYHIQHSIGLPQAPELPGRVRGNIHFCAFFRQDWDLSVEMYATGVCDPGGPVLKSLLLYPMSLMLLASTEYAHCGEMKKLAWIMQHRNAQKKQMGTKRNDDNCVMCSSPVSHSRMGKLSTTRGSCKLCFNAVCRSCRVRKLVTFVEPDLNYNKRKVTFCPVCIKEALSVSALRVARDQTLAPERLRDFRQSSNFSATCSSDE
ncbi:unnamed protein product [Peronospora belbahrii]|uniref:FYVE-type domain-containing protein n=1 Tax=Peronospora belbahrii TaxID=622444 RepID=A0AAU9KYM4_9STRA|nr:unnamed protein product [Peronospora belbahrii]CAH0514383.1 unnamed protein product [Peronospora belbahrii]